MTQTKGLTGRIDIYQDELMALDELIALSLNMTDGDKTRLKKLKMITGALSQLEGEDRFFVVLSKTRSHKGESQGYALTIEKITKIR